VIVLAIPPQFIHHFRKPSWSTESEPAAIEELADDD
jgi:hypothetical protein